MNYLFVAAVLPAAVLLIYVYKKDTVEKEPIKLIARLFVLGMVAGPLAGITEGILFEFFESFLAPGALLLALEYFVGVAAVEEGFKYLFLSTVRKNKEFDYVFDGIVYSVAVALGFAALENILYVFDGGLGVALSRAVFSVPGHCADGVVMGALFGLAKQAEVQGDKAKARSRYWLAFLLPTIEHGFYDCFLSTEIDALALLALAGQIAFIIYAMTLVNRISKNDSPIYGITRQAIMDGVALQAVAPPPMQPNQQFQQPMQPGQQFPQQTQPGQQQYQQPMQQQFPQQLQQFQQPAQQQYPQQVQQFQQQYPADSPNQNNE